ncbi:MAG: alpha/beta hydrolase [Pseudomonadota bacterium]
MNFFTDFDLVTLDTPAGKQRLRVGGDGPPMVLIHGNPQTHAMWHAVAPELARHYTVYCPDLRGYGTSPKPPASDDSVAYSKRAMASDITWLMDHYGHDRVTVVSHDRGARAAHRLALDHPGRVDRLAVLDIVPTIEHFERTDMAFALAYAHWFYLAMPAPFPEEMMAGNPERWFARHCGRTSAPEDLFAPEALADYLDHVRLPEVITGICEDYRAATGIDLAHDRASRDAGERIQCPLLVLWGSQGIIGKFYDPVALWQKYCDGPVTGAAVDAGHYLAEEAPEAVLAHLRTFLDLPSP